MDSTYDSPAIRLRRGLQDIRDMFSERRSDVEEICQDVLQGKPADKSKVEHRYVKWEYAGKRFLYDTLTTLVEVEEKPGNWEVLNTEYSND